MNVIRSIYFIDVYRLEERENNGFDFQLFQPSITHFLCSPAHNHTERDSSPCSAELLFPLWSRSPGEYINVFCRHTITKTEIYGIPKTITSFSKLINFVFDVASHNDTYIGENPSFVRQSTDASVWKLIWFLFSWFFAHLKSKTSCNWRNQVVVHL